MNPPICIRPRLYTFKCALQSCKNKRIENVGIGYFKFPVNYPTKCAKWLECSGLSIPLDTILTKNYRICGKHFEKHMFVNDRRNRLKKNALPLLYPDKNDELNPETIEVETQDKILKTKRVIRTFIHNSQCINVPEKHNAIFKTVQSMMCDYNAANKNVVTQNDLFNNKVLQNNNPHTVDASSANIQGRKISKNVTGKVTNIKSTMKYKLCTKSYKVLEEHNYFNDTRKKKYKSKHLNTIESSKIKSFEESNDDTLPEWLTNNDEEDEKSDNETKSLAQLLKLEYEKDSNRLKPE